MDFDAACRIAVAGADALPGRPGPAVAADDGWEDAEGYAVVVAYLTGDGLVELDDDLVHTVRKVDGAYRAMRYLPLERRWAAMTAVSRGSQVRG